MCNCAITLFNNLRSKRNLVEKLRSKSNLVDKFKERIPNGEVHAYYLDALCKPYDSTFQFSKELSMLAKSEFPPNFNSARLKVHGLVAG